MLLKSFLYLIYWINNLSNPIRQKQITPADIPPITACGAWRLERVYATQAAIAKAKIKFMISRIILITFSLTDLFFIVQSPKILFWYRKQRIEKNRLQIKVLRDRGVWIAYSAKAIPISAIISPLKYSIVLIYFFIEAPLYFFIFLLYPLYWFMSRNFYISIYIYLLFIEIMFYYI